MVDPLLASYEAVPYESAAIAASDIGRLEAVAVLHGLTPTPAASARVLELGCASGGNLLSMAYRYPDAQFVGIDLTPGQIGVGQEMIARIGLTNLTLHAMSITDITDAFGMFDYIIAHGVYSWVPPEVQDALLRVCKRNLAPHGVAYVSYNTLPGWHTKLMVRDMMLYHDVAKLSTSERITRALDFIEVLRGNTYDPESFHARELARELAILKRQPHAYLLHEQFEAFNLPIYFAEFAQRASSKELRFLAEAKLADRAYVPTQWAEDAAGAGADLIRLHQYVDFAVGRMFRRTLLCHEGLTTNDRPDASRMMTLQVALLGHRAEGSPTPAGAESYEATDGVTVTTSSAETLAAFRVLERVKPASLSFTELYRRVCDLLSVTAPPGTPIPAGRASTLADSLLACAFAGLIDVTSHASSVQWNASERPLASLVARTTGPSKNFAPNLSHVLIELSPLASFLLPLLDGTNDREQLLWRVTQALDSGAFALAGERPTPSALEASIDLTLTTLAKGGLLEA